MSEMKNKKLQLNKETIAELDNMENVLGGEGTFLCTTQYPNVCDTAMMSCKGACPQTNLIMYCGETAQCEPLQSSDCFFETRLC